MPFSAISLSALKTVSSGVIVQTVEPLVSNNCLIVFISAILSGP